MWEPFILAEQSPYPGHELLVKVTDCSTGEMTLILR